MHVFTLDGDGHSLHFADTADRYARNVAALRLLRDLQAAGRTPGGLGRDERHRGDGIVGPTDDLHLVGLVQQQLEAAAEERMVVDEDDRHDGHGRRMPARVRPTPRVACKP